MFCKHCGVEIENDSTFCRYCGKKQISEEKQENNITNDDDTKERNIGCAIIIVLIILLIASFAIPWAIDGIKSCNDNKKDTDTSSETEDTSTDTNKYMRQAGVNDLKITTRENYPTSIYYIITAERDIYDLEIDLEEYADDGTLTRTVHFNIGDLKQGEKYTMRLNISEYTDSEINNIDIVYVKVVGGKTSSLTVIPVA